MSHTLLQGKPVREAIEAEMLREIESLREEGIRPGVAVLRVGEKSGDIYYQNSINRSAERYGIGCTNVNFADGTPQEEIEAALKQLNLDPNIHGIIMMMPFPKYIQDERLRALLEPGKDIDAITDQSYAKLFANRSSEEVFYACTAEACMEILEKNGISLEGKRVVIAGRSLRIGKPLLMMMLNANATVTICHTRTRKEDLHAAIREADIVVLATGAIESFRPELFRDGQIIVDAGTGTGRDGKMAGDFDAKALSEEGAPASLIYSPVPGGVGTVTTTLLLRNVLKAARRHAALHEPA